MDEDKEAVEVEIPTKKDNRIKSLKTHSGAHMTEATLEAGGAKEDAKFFKEMIHMQIIVVAGHVANQTTLKQTIHGRTRVIGGNKIIMYQAVIKKI